MEAAGEEEGSQSIGSHAATDLDVWFENGKHGFEILKVFSQPNGT